MGRISATIERARLLAARGGELGGVLERLASLHGEVTMAIQMGGIRLAGGRKSVTFAEAAGIVASVAEQVRPRCAGRRPVVVTGPNGYDLWLTCLGVSRAGGIVIPVNDKLAEDEIEWIREDSGACRVQVDELARVMGSPEGPGGRPSTRRDIPGPEDVAAILYTSGTTGKPKGAMLSHRALLEQVSRLLLVPPSIARTEAVCALPIAHIMGFEVLLAAAFAGMTVYFLPRFRPIDVLDAIEVRRPSVFVGVPAMYRMLEAAGAADRTLRSIQLWISASDYMPDDLARRFQSYGSTLHLPGIEKGYGEAVFADAYGMVELGGAAAARIFLPKRANRDPLLFPLPPFKMRVVDEDGRECPPGVPGELEVAGGGVLKGYHRNEAADSAMRRPDGFVKTGDVACRARWGLFQIVGRRKEVIKHGGYSVFVAEIDDVLRAHPAVADAAALARPDPVKGEVPIAFVELKPGSRVEPDELRQWAAERLADYKAPVDVYVIDKLPRTSTRKVARKELAALDARRRA